MPYRISNIDAVATNGKAIRSTAPGTGTVWFYRGDDRVWHAHHTHGDGKPRRYTIDAATVERNVDHDDTDVDTVPVEESPLADMVQ